MKLIERNCILRSPYNMVTNIDATIYNYRDPSDRTHNSYGWATQTLRNDNVPMRRGYKLEGRYITEIVDVAYEFIHWK